MAEEFAKKPYYNEVSEDFHWIDVHNSACVVLEAYLAKLLLKGDTSRVIYSSKDMCFRRRIELMDTETTKKPETGYNAISLNLPFVSYFQTGEIEKDDRSSVMQMNSAIIGEYIDEVGQDLRMVAFKSRYEATLFLARRDEVRFAQNVLYFEKEPQHPLYFKVGVNWRGATLEIPISFTIESIKTNVEYKETDFLTNSRIFPVSIEFTLRSYQILINGIDHIYKLPIRFGNKFSSDTKENCEESGFIVEEVILDWICEKWGMEAPLEVEPETNDFDIIIDRVFPEEDLTEEELMEMQKIIPNYEACDIYKGYFTLPALETTFEVSDISVNSCKLNFTIVDDSSQLLAVRVLVPSREEIVLTNEDIKNGFIKIDGLFPNSEYKIKILVYLTNHDCSLYNIAFTTLDHITNKAPEKDIINKNGNALIGFKF